jgi:hypothetical protein
MDHAMERVASIRDARETDGPEYGDLVLMRTRERFVAENPHPFLLGVDALARPRGPQRTVAATEYRDVKRFLGDQALQLRALCPMALAVRKVTTAFPSMITIGRTSNNDLIISDIAVSKFHAFIREAEGGWQLLDAASSNGTFMGEKRLDAREPYALPLGSLIRLGRLRFQFLDAGACWDRVRQERLGEHAHLAL